MGKKKKANADRVRNKRKPQEKKTNPFEVKINKQKHNVLGRKISKHDRGMPGLSRMKATQRRMETLLPEFKQQFKSNKFVDKRIGERDTTLSLEEKMMKRYAVERSKTGEKQNKFNLNEDEELTHYGQSLSQIEKFDEPVISDEEEDEEDRKRQAKIVASEHFGGFLTKRVEADGEPKSWKERMEELIANSKKAKYERQKEKEETIQMTEKVDEEWKSLMSLMSKGSKKSEEDTPSGKKIDDFDIAVRELKFEVRGQATDRLKTEEELAREEKERLEKLEADRIRRMKGLTEDTGGLNTVQHQSADDLDDGFALDRSDFDYVSYKDGALLGEGNKEEQDEDDDDEEEEGSEDEEEENVNKDGKNTEESDEASVIEDTDNDDSDDDEADTDDSYGDIMSEEEEDEEGDDKKEMTRQTTSKKLAVKAKEKMMEEAKKEIPYTFKAPDSYDDLLDLLQGHDLEGQLTIIERIIKCHHPSLAEGNKQKLETLFSHLVQFFGDLCIQDPPQLDFADRVIPHLYKLTNMSPVAAAAVVLDNMSDRQDEFRQICERKQGRGLFPALDTLLLLKLVGVLFPTSDFRHPVTTPAMLFICQMLSQCPVNHERDVTAGLFLANLCLEYVSLSKRFVPEAVNFLHGLLFLAANKEDGKIEAVIPPFRPVGKHINLLQVTQKTESVTPKWSMTEMLSTTIEKDALSTDGFRVSTIHHCMILLGEFSRQYETLPAYKEIFTPVIDMCRKLPVKMYPEYVQTLIQKFVSQVEDKFSKTRSYLVMRKKKPVPMKMFEPKLEEVFDGRKKKSRGTKDFNEKQKLLHKYKKEMKGAQREIRKDNQFLARQKLQEQMARDVERKRKVKEIYGMLSSQEGEFKKMKRLKEQEAHKR